MSSSFTLSESATFTVVHARHMAAKVKTDLTRLHRLYDHPSATRVDQFETELTELLRHGYLGTVTYGFKRDGKLIEPTLRYTAQQLASGDVDDDPGKIKPGLDITGATFYSYLTYSDKWDNLTPAQQQAFEGALPFQRSDAPAPGVSGYFVDDRLYSAGGRALGRSSLRSYA